MIQTYYKNNPDWMAYYKYVPCSYNFDEAVNGIIDNGNNYSTFLTM